MADNLGLKESLVASEEKLADAEPRIQEFDHNKDTLEDLVINVDEEEAELITSEDHVRFDEDKIKRSSQLVEGIVTSSEYWEGVVVFENVLANASALAARLTTQHIVEKGLFDVVCMALTIYKAGTQQRATADAGNREMLLADKTAIDTEFRKFWERMQAMID